MKASVLRLGVVLALLIALVGCNPNSNGGASEPTFSLSATGGTFNTGASTLGTIFAYKLILSNGNLSRGAFYAKFEGPPGWNNNQPAYQVGVPGNFIWFLNVPVVSGTYTLTLTPLGATTGDKGTFTIDATLSQPQVGNVDVTTATPNQVEANWGPATSASSYLMELSESNSGHSLAFSMTKKLSAVLRPNPGLDISEPARQYALWVYAFDSDISDFLSSKLLPKQLNASGRNANLTFTAPTFTISSVSAPVSISWGSQSNVNISYTGSPKLPMRLHFHASCSPSDCPTLAQNISVANGTNPIQYSLKCAFNGPKPAAATYTGYFTLEDADGTFTPLARGTWMCVP